MRKRAFHQCEIEMKKKMRNSHIYMNWKMNFPSKPDARLHLNIVKSEKKNKNQTHILIWMCAVSSGSVSQPFSIMYTTQTSSSSTITTTTTSVFIQYIIRMKVHWIDRQCATKKQWEWSFKINERFLLFGPTYDDTRVYAILFYFFLSLSQILSNNNYHISHLALDWNLSMDCSTLKFFICLIDLCNLMCSMKCNGIFIIFSIQRNWWENRWSITHRAK